MPEAAKVDPGPALHSQLLREIARSGRETRPRLRPRNIDVDVDVDLDGNVNVDLDDPR